MRRSKTSAKVRGITRELYRAFFESQSGSNAERRIVDRYDPTIAWDPAHALIVSAHTLQGVRTAAQFAAQTLGMMLPASFNAIERSTIAHGFAAADFAKKLAYARVESNLPLGLPALERLDIPQRRQALGKWGVATDGITLARASVASVLYAAGQTAGLAKAGYPSGQGDRAGSMMGSMADRQIRQNIFQLGHPGCSHGVLDTSSTCNSAPINSPLSLNVSFKWPQ